MPLKLGTLFIEFAGDNSKLKRAQKEVKDTNETVSKSFKALGATVVAVLGIQSARAALSFAEKMTL